MFKGYLDEHVLEAMTQNPKDLYNSRSDLSPPISEDPNYLKKKVSESISLSLFLLRPMIDMCK